MPGLTWGRRQAAIGESAVLVNLSRATQQRNWSVYLNSTSDYSRAEVISDKLRTVDLTSLIVRVPSMGKIYKRFEHMGTKKES
jgi:hypothetical protein